MDATPETSRRMAAVRRQNTAPEQSVQSCLSSLGYEFKTHATHLPGTPDIVFSAEMKAIFVHGCYWHRHPGCKFATTPKTNVQYWKDKFADNVRRDKAAIDSLRELGWCVLVVWSCEVSAIEDLKEKLCGFVGARCETR